MGALANSIKNAMLDATFGAGANANYFYRLFTAAPTLPNATNEIAGAGYAAAQATNNAANFPAAANGKKSNGARIEFPLATANYSADVTHVGLATTASGNTLVAIIELDNPLTITTGKGVEILVGDIEFEITDQA